MCAGSLTTPTSEIRSGTDLDAELQPGRPRRGRRSPAEPWLVEEQGCTSQYGQHHRSRRLFEGPHDANCAYEVGCQRFRSASGSARGQAAKQLIRGTAWHRHDCIVWLKLDQFIKGRQEFGFSANVESISLRVNCCTSDTPSRLLRTRAWLQAHHPEADQSAPQCRHWLSPASVFTASMIRSMSADCSAG